MEEGKVSDGVVFQELCSSFINKLRKFNAQVQARKFRLIFGASKV